MHGSFVAYYRVSTERQGKSGLGLTAQRQAVQGYLNGGDWRLLAEFTEVESGKNNNRPQLAAAMRECQLTGARLLIAKLDRLSRNAHFLLGLRDAGVKFVACDMPDANDLTIGIMALVAQQEREAISARTKAALAHSTKKLGGWRGGPKVNSALGTAARATKAAAFLATLHPIVTDLREQGVSLRGIAEELQRREIKTAAGGKWSAQTVARILG